MNPIIIMLRFNYRSRGSFGLGSLVSRLLTTKILDIECNRKDAEHFDSIHFENLNQIKQSMFIVPDFVTEDEEQNLLQEIEDVFVRKRIRYERSHWDDAIHDYREIEHLNWSSKNQSIIERIRLNAFKTNKKHIRFVHILDVTKQGYIKPHVDSVRVNLIMSKNE